MKMYELFLTCPKGLEQICKKEIESICSSKVQRCEGGVSLIGSIADIYKINFNSRIQEIFYQKKKLLMLKKS